MKIGFLSTILYNYSFEEVIDIAADLNYDCVELACGIKGQFPCHLDIEDLDEQVVNHVNNYCSANKITLSALCFYPNIIGTADSKREQYIEHLKNLIKSASLLNVNTVATFIGRDPHKTTKENLNLYKEIWTPIVSFAEQFKVRIAIENCPMYMTDKQWPSGNNLATTPMIWDMMFELIPSNYLGLNYDPSHLLWQNIDYIKPIYDYKEKLFHVHIKDLKLRYNNLRKSGTMDYPINFTKPKLPGFGDINWAKFFSALYDINYSGYACIEAKDNCIQNTIESIINALEISYRQVSKYLI